MPEPGLEAYKGVFDSTVEGIVVVDAATGRVALANKAAASIFGFDSPEDMVGADPLQHIPQEDRERVAAWMVENTLEKNLHRVMELKVRGNGGKETPVTATGVRIEYAGRPAALATLRDVTAQKAAEKAAQEAETALRESEERYRLLAENASDIIWTTDANLRITYTSPATTRLLGYSLEEIYAGSFQKFLTPHSVEVVGQAFKDGLARERSEPGSLGGQTLELEVACKDGSTAWLEVAVGVIRNQEGRFAGFQGACRDVTERKGAAEALQESEARFRRLSEAAEEGIAIHDRGIIVEANEALARMFGYQSSELIGMNAERLSTPESWRVILKHIASGLEEPYEGEGVRKDGSTFWCSLVGKPYQYKGKTLRLAAFRDITKRKQAEESLQQQEQRFRAIAENSSDVIVLLNREGAILYESPAAQRVLGFGPEERVGASVFSLVHPEDLPAVTDAFKELLRNPGAPVLRGEVRLQHKDGSWRIIEASGRGVVRGSVVEGAVVNLRDVTERKRAEKALQESERQYRLLAENVSDVIWVTDTNLRPLYLSPSISQFLGYGMDEAMSRSIIESLTPASLDMAMQALTSAVSEGSEEPAAAVPPRHLELLFNRKDGSHVWADTSASLIRDNEGRPIRIVGVLRDVTERKMAEKALRESEQKFRNLVEATSDWVWEMDKRSVYTYVSPKVRDVLGYEAEDLVGKTPFDFMPPNEARRMTKAFKSIVAGQKPFAFLENTSRHKDGRAVVLETSGVPFFDDSGVLLGYRGIDRDITERKLIARQLQASLRKLERTMESTIQAITSTMETRDPYTAGHQKRVTELACAIAKEMGLPDAQIAGIRVAGLLHDIGKISVPTEILSKPGLLTDVEMAMIKTHPRVGHDILKGIEFSWPVARTVLQHHERFDGSGYPAGVRGHALLLEARILAVADVVEAMSSHRPYRAARGIETALEEVSRGSGTLYDPDVVRYCLKVFADGGFNFESP